MQGKWIASPNESAFDDQNDCLIEHTPQVLDFSDKIMTGKWTQPAV